MRADVDRLDMREELARIAGREGPGLLPESAATIRLDEGMEAVGRALERSPAERRAEEEELEEISREEMREARAWFLRKKTGTDG